MITRKVIRMPTSTDEAMVIGALSGISYPAFSAALAPVALFGLVAVIVIVRIVYRSEFARSAELSPEVYRGRMLPGQVWKSVIVCVGLAAAFFAGVPVAKAALIGGAILLLTRAIKPARIYREIDGPLLFMNR